MRRVAVQGADLLDHGARVTDQGAAQLGHQLAERHMHGHRGHLPDPPFMALMTLSVMSTRGLKNTASCKIRSYFS